MFRETPPGNLGGDLSPHAETKVHEPLARSSTAEEAAAELADMVDGIEALFDAYAADAIDLCPALERLLIDILDQAATDPGEAATVSPAAAAH